MTRRNAESLLVVFTVLALGASCARRNDDGNASPTIAAVADQSVTRNVELPGLLELPLQIVDADDAVVQVEVASDDESVLPATTQVCLVGACVLELRPSVESPASVNVDLTVTDGHGGQAATSFVLSIVPRLVTSVEDSGAGSLRRQIDEAAAGDVIAFDTDGTFGSAQTILLLGELFIDKDLVIEGPGATELTLSGGDAVRVLHVTGGATVDISDLTIADGRAPLELFEVGTASQLFVIGGGVYAEGGSDLTLGGCTVTDNRAVNPNQSSVFGGGIASFEARVILTNGSRVENNTAGDGGGILVFTLGDESVVVVTDSTVTNNVATSSGGGGIYNLGGSVIVSGSEISDNQAPTAGGGIGNEGSLVIRDGTTVTGNSSGSNGGGVHSTSYVELDGCEVSGNQATDNGGGLYNSGVADVQAGTTITGNTATSGGGVFSTGSAMLVNDGTVSGNTPDDVVGP